MPGEDPTIIANKKITNKDYRHHSLLTFTYFNTSYLNSQHHYEGQKVSHTPDGLRFMTSLNIIPGETLLIKLNCGSSEYPSQEAWEGYRSITLAKVLWCRPVNDKTDSRFMVGVKYCDLYY